MQKFQDYLVEDKNTHLEHLEDEIINNGSRGARTAIEFLKSIKQMLQGGSGGSTVSVKWDGALSSILWYQSREWQILCCN